VKDIHVDAYGGVARSCWTCAIQMREGLVFERDAGFAAFACYKTPDPRRKLSAVSGSKRLFRYQIMEFALSDTGEWRLDRLQPSAPLKRALSNGMR